MSDSQGPTSFRSASRSYLSAAPTPASKDEESVGFDLDEVDPEEPPAEREGLPPGFQMRHDAHYVEHVLGDAPPTARRARWPAAVSDEVLESLWGVSAVLGSLPREGRPLRERVALDLALAETRRAARLFGALRVLNAEPSARLTETNLGGLVQEVVDEMGPEWRLSGVAHSYSAPERPCRVRVDGDLLPSAVAAVLEALARVFDRADAPRLSIRVSSSTDGESHLVECAELAVTLPAPVRDRLFDVSQEDHPLGPVAALALAAARRIAELHGGTLTASDVDGAGLRFVLSIPAIR